MYILPSLVGALEILYSYYCTCTIPYYKIIWFIEPCPELHYTCEMPSINDGTTGVSHTLWFRHDSVQPMFTVGLVNILILSCIAILKSVLIAIFSVNEKY